MIIALIVVTLVAVVALALCLVYKVSVLGMTHYMLMHGIEIDDDEMKKSIRFCAAKTLRANLGLKR